MSIRIAIAQINPKLVDLRANPDLYEGNIVRARTQAANLLNFPDLSLTVYFLRDTGSTIVLTMRSAEITKSKAFSRKLPFVVDMVSQIIHSQLKRRLPVIAKVSQRTIDRDFRCSRDWGRS